MADLNRMLQLAQSTGGSPYDEDQFMPVPGSSQANHWLNKRLDNRLMQQGTGDGYNSGFWGNMHRQMSERIPHMMTPEGYVPSNPGQGGADKDMNSYDGVGLGNIVYGANNRGWGATGKTPVNNFLDKRIMDVISPYDGSSGISVNQGPQAGPPSGSDSQMLDAYGPPDQVAYDGQGNPILLADPRHPMSQRRQQMPQNMLMYPQRR